MLLLEFSNCLQKNEENDVSSVQFENWVDSCAIYLFCSSRLADSTINYPDGRGVLIKKKFSPVGGEVFLKCF